MALLGASGDREPYFTAFVNRYERLLRSCVLKVLRRYGAASSSDEVDDVVSEVWVALLRNDLGKLRKYDPARGLKLTSFLGMVATHTAID